MAAVEPILVVPSPPARGSGSSNAKPACGKCGKNGHPTEKCWGARKGAHWPGRRAEKNDSAVAAQLSDLVSKLGGEQAACRELAADNKELTQQNGELTSKLKKAEASVKLASARHDALVNEWKTGRKLIYRDTPFTWSDAFALVRIAKFSFSLSLALWMFHVFCVFIHDGLISAIMEAVITFWSRFLYWGIAVAILPGLYSVFIDLYNSLFNSGPAGIFRSLVRWEYTYLGDYVHDHGDLRADNNSLQDIKHAPMYAEFRLARGFMGLPLDPERNSVVIVSLELLVQICNPKNLDPFLAPSEARSAFQRSAAHNHTVSIDRHLVLKGSYVYQETVSLAYFNYLVLRAEWKKRDFLPSLL